LFASGSLKVGLGAMQQTVDISGSLVTNDFTNFGPTQTFPGGYFALPSNIGTYNRAVFAVLPELGLNIGFQITSWASVFVGYTFLYTNDVVRPGKQVNRNINPTQSVSWTVDPSAQPTPPGAARLAGARPSIGWRERGRRAGAHPRRGPCSPAPRARPRCGRSRRGRA
jgi:hypothetical protein